jgi:hypothetical protein
MERVAPNPGERPKRLLTGDHLENFDLSATIPTRFHLVKSEFEIQKYSFSVGFDVRYLRNSYPKTLRIPDEERRKRENLLTAQMYKQLHGKDVGQCWFCLASDHPDPLYRNSQTERNRLLRQPNEEERTAYPKTSECPWHQLYMALLKLFRAQPSHEQHVQVYMSLWDTAFPPLLNVLGKTRLDHADANAPISKLYFSGRGWGDGKYSFYDIYSSPGQYKGSFRAVQ